MKQKLLLKNVGAFSVSVIYIYIRILISTFVISTVIQKEMLTINYTPSPTKAVIWA